jgi:hypothetical protein
LVAVCVATAGVDATLFFADDFATALVVVAALSCVVVAAAVASGCRICTKGDADDAPARTPPPGATTVKVAGFAPVNTPLFAVVVVVLFGRLCPEGAAAAPVRGRVTAANDDDDDDDDCGCCLDVVDLVAVVVVKLLLLRVYVGGGGNDGGTEGTAGAVMAAVVVGGCKAEAADALLVFLTLPSSFLKDADFLATTLRVV